MNKIFNTTFESSLRILLLLSVSEDEQMTLDRIADYDFITIYSKYFGISDMALHGENEFGLSEFAARRGMMQSTMKSLVLDGLVSVKRRLNGFQYSISSHGKGYHSYLNTVVALAFRNYFHDHAKYNADFLIIDTPLHGFDENDTELPDNMKDGLFKYFVHHLTGQLIIVENTDHVPSNIDFEALGANVITFTKKRDEGRYGFLHDVY